MMDMNMYMHMQAVEAHQRMMNEHIQMNNTFIMQQQMHQSSSATAPSSKKVLDASRESGLSIAMEAECMGTYIALQGKRPNNISPKAYSYAMGEKFFNELKKETDQTKKLILKFILNKFVEDYKFWC